MREFREIEELCEIDVEQGMYARRLTPKKRKQIIREFFSKYSIHNHEVETILKQETESQEISKPSFTEIRSLNRMDIALTHHPEYRFMRG